MGQKVVQTDLSKVVPDHLGCSNKWSHSDFGRVFHHAADAPKGRGGDKLLWPATALCLSITPGPTSKEPNSVEPVIDDSPYYQSPEAPGALGAWPSSMPLLTVGREGSAGVRKGGCRARVRGRPSVTKKGHARSASTELLVYRKQPTTSTTPHQYINQEINSCLRRPPMPIMPCT